MVVKWFFPICVEQFNSFELGIGKGYIYYGFNVFDYLSLIIHYV